MNVEFKLVIITRIHLGKYSGLHALMHCYLVVFKYLLFILNLLVWIASIYICFLPVWSEVSDGLNLFSTLAGKLKLKFCLTGSVLVNLLCRQVFIYLFCKVLFWILLVSVCCLLLHCLALVSLLYLQSVKKYECFVLIFCASDPLWLNN